MAQKKRNNKIGIGKQITSAFEGAKEEIGEAREKADKYIGDHPMQSVAIAAGVGAIVAIGVTIGVTAFLLRPRRKSGIDRLLDIF